MKGHFTIPVRPAAWFMLGVCVLVAGISAFLGDWAWVWSFCAIGAVLTWLLVTDDKTESDDERAKP